MLERPTNRRVLRHDRGRRSKDRRHGTRRKVSGFGPYLGRLLPTERLQRFAACPQATGFAPSTARERSRRPSRLSGSRYEIEDGDQTCRPPDGVRGIGRNQRRPRDKPPRSGPAELERLSEADHQLKRVMRVKLSRICSPDIEQPTRSEKHPTYPTSSSERGSSAERRCLSTITECFATDLTNPRRGLDVSSGSLTLQERSPRGGIGLRRQVGPSEWWVSFRGPRVRLRSPHGELQGGVRAA